MCHAYTTEEQRRYRRRNKVLASSLSVLPRGGLSPALLCQHHDTYLEESHAALAVAVLAEHAGHDEECGEGALCVWEYVCACVGGGVRESSVLAICC